MSDFEDLGSDSSDDDYRPSDGEAVSEEEGSGDDEDVDALNKEAGDDASISKKRKDKKKSKTFSKKQRLGNEFAEEIDGKIKNTEIANEFQIEKQQLKEIEEKKRADALMSDFFSGVPAKPKPKPIAHGLGSLSTSVKSPNCVKSPAAYPSTTIKSFNPVSSSKSEKITITKEYDFAGETIKVTEQVDINSKEAKAELSKKSFTSNIVSDSPKIESSSASGLTNSPSFGSNRQSPAGGGGLGSVLGKINKKSTISTLNKSKLDWESFKSEQGIGEELQKFNKGKDGYLERQDFLARVDLNQFEIEKSLRLSKTFKR